jgi:hypothetical protein
MQALGKELGLKAQVHASLLQDPEIISEDEYPAGLYR